MIRLSLVQSSRLLAASLLTATLASCLETKPDSCSTDALAPATSVSSAKKGQVGTPVEVRYTVQIANSCGQFKSLEERRSGNNIYLSPLVAYQGCACPQVVTDYNGTYKFTPTQAGKYVVHFLKVDNTVLTDTLTIQ